MVGTEYMLARPSRPGPTRRFLDQQAIPVLADAAGTLEAGLNRVGEATRSQPLPMLAAAVLLGAALGRGAIYLARR